MAYMAIRLEPEDAERAWQVMKERKIEGYYLDEFTWALTQEQINELQASGIAFKPVPMPRQTPRKKGPAHN